MFLDKGQDMIFQLQQYKTAHPFKYSIYDLHKLYCMWV